MKQDSKAEIRQEMTPEEMEEYARQFYIDLVNKELQTASLQDIKIALAFIRG